MRRGRAAGAGGGDAGRARSAAAPGAPRSLRLPLPACTVVAPLAHVRPPALCPPQYLSVAVCLYLGACTDPPSLVFEYCAKSSLDMLLRAGLRHPQVRERDWAMAVAGKLCTGGGTAAYHGHGWRRACPGCSSEWMSARQVAPLRAAARSPLALPACLPACFCLQMAKRLTWVRLLSLALDAAKGMLYLHSRSPPIAHRDLKSANLLVDSQWHVKV